MAPAKLGDIIQPHARTAGCGVLRTGPRPGLVILARRQRKCPVHARARRNRCKGHGRRRRRAFGRVRGRVRVRMRKGGIRVEARGRRSVLVLVHRVVRLVNRKVSALPPARAHAAALGERVGVRARRCVLGRGRRAAVLVVAVEMQTRVNGKRAARCIGRGCGRERGGVGCAEEDLCGGIDLVLLDEFCSPGADAS
jgi:hypothetical protein